MELGLYGVGMASGQYRGTSHIANANSRITKGNPTRRKSEKR